MVSTLLEILAYVVIINGKKVLYLSFQPFLRFWSPGPLRGHLDGFVEFQPFLRFWPTGCCSTAGRSTSTWFQPFLRFWGSCVWLLWVFKFFFGFL